MALEVTLRDGTLCIARKNENAEELLNKSFKARKQTLCNYNVTALGSFPMGKRYTIPFKITADENEKLYLLQELTEEEKRNAELEPMRKIEELFGIQLWKEEEEPENMQLPDYFSGYSNDETLYVCIYSHSKQLFAFLGTKEEIYHSIVRFVCKIEDVRFTKTDLVFKLYAKLENPYHLNIGMAHLSISEAKSEAHPIIQEEHVTGVKKIEQEKYALTLSIPISTLSNYSKGENSLVHLEGNPCKLTVLVDDIPIQYSLVKRPSSKKRHGQKHSVREVWVPLISVYNQGMALHMRRAFRGGYILYKRYMQPVEYSRWFRFMESKPVSATMFQLGRILNHVPFRKKVALFYEKFAEKAEEGTYELCRLCSASSKRTRCYFVIDKNAPDYERVKEDPCVVKKYSLKYYWLFYNVNYFIATDAPAHLNLMNSNNRYIRWTCIRHPFFFLQHGITYLKPHGDRSTYLKDHPGEAKYVIVSSEKEKQIVSSSFHISPNRIFKTGMLMFDHVEYNHITQATPNTITVMLTWKPYEETLDNYENSTYYQYTLEIYNLLLKYVDRSQINIVAHPRAHDLLMSTSLRDLVWTRPISEVLKETKLLITDYSSVCWNSFYQGGGVVFFQPDLQEYEDYIGKLIPNDDEYIGYRTYDIDGLEQILSSGLENGAILLDKFRNEEFERRYSEINEFHDGKNTQRVYEALKAEKII